MSNQKKLTGLVVSNKMDKTAVAVVNRWVKHPVVGKLQKLSKRYKVHDENNVLKIGDTIVMGEVRPISKDKSWTLIEVVGHAAGVEE